MNQPSDRERVRELTKALRQIQQAAKGANDTIYQMARAALGETLTPAEIQDKVVLLATRTLQWQHEPDETNIWCAIDDAVRDLKREYPEVSAYYMAMDDTANEAWIAAVQNRLRHLWR